MAHLSETRRALKKLGSVLRGFGLLALLATLVPAGGLWAAPDPVFDNKGFSPNREFASELGFEHVDPLTGNLLLTFTDLVLPGNAGFDLAIQRTYNIKIYDYYARIDVGGSTIGSYTLGENAALGLGWTMHMGRIVKNLNSNNPGPTIEMPDGSSHASFRHMDANPTHYITRELWTLDRFGEPYDSSPSSRCSDLSKCMLLRLPNGVRYVFGQIASADARYVSWIYDSFGNSVHVSYLGYPDQYLVSSVEQRFATGERRTVTFTYSDPLPGGPQFKRLTSMGYGGHVWNYTQEVRGPLQGPKAFVLRTAQPPAGPAWTFDYYDAAWPSAFLLKSVTTPHGGTLAYEHQDQVFRYGSHLVYSPVVKTRTASGTDIATGTWSYAFSSPGPWDPVVATVTQPCRTIVYRTHALGGAGDEQAWRIGALQSKETRAGTTPYETETYVWTPSEQISTDVPPGESVPPRVPLLQSRTLTRGGLTYTTANTYSSGAYSPSSHRNFNDYGRPESTTETGQLTRTTSRTFYPDAGSDPSFGTYIVDKAKSESVSVGDDTNGPYTHSYVYDGGNPTGLTQGFLTSATVYGITTTFAADGGGNVATRKDASGNLTRFQWRWGVPWSMATPQYTILRGIGGDSTIQWQQRQGDETPTRYTYDELFRLTRVHPRLGNDTITTYAADGRTATVSRGSSSTTSTLDGFGRVSFTSNSLGIKADVNYDSCGRKTYESYPYTTSNIGSTLEYDALDRLRFKRNPGGSFVEYAYGTDVADQKVVITDELSRQTDQVWRAFGNPGDARLVKVVDAGSGPGGARQTTSYSYNGLGGLTGVSPASGGARSWTYVASTDRRQSETQPESGQVSYSYYPNGLVRARTDAQFSQTQFEYDGNGRLTLANRPGTYPDTVMAYDNWDNRKFLGHGNVTGDLTYDENNRLTRRIDKIAGRSFTTTYAYDDDDRLRRIVYPSGTLARYFYDSEGRVTKVTSDELGSVPYADAFQYHPSGGVSSYRSGNGIVNTVGYDANRYWITQAASAGVVSVLYDQHDLVGNVTHTVDSNLGSYGFGYDPVDRLTSATRTPSSGGWGNGSYTYDPMGNRTSKTIAGAATTYVYSASSNRLTSAAGAEPVPSFGYDANGNTTSDGTGAYVFDPDNMMTSATVGGAQTTYGYDADNLRKLKQQPTSTRYYVHGPGNQILSEFQKAGTQAVPVRDYVYAGARLLASVRPPVLTATPDELSFAVVRNTTGEPTRPVVIDTGGTSLPWLASASCPGTPGCWITLSPTSGTGTPRTLNVGVNVTGLQVGIYTGSVTVTSAGALGSPKTVPVRLAVVPTSGLVAMPRPLRFVVQEGTPDVVPQNEYILRAGGAAVPWSATVSQSWLVLSASSGTTPSTVEVTVNPAGLTRGTRYGWITVTSPGVTGSPQLVPVELVITAGAGAACEAGAWYCEPFDGLATGPIDGQGGWLAQRVLMSQVEPDPRGTGHALLVDPPSWSDGTVNDVRNVSDHAIDGTQISVQLMSVDVPVEAPQVAKLEFFTVPNVAWGKTRRTYGALRFGNKLYLQFGPNIYKVLVDAVESERWYDVKVVYQGGKIYAYVDGVQRFVTSNPLSGAYPTQAFVVSGWDRPGQAYLDLIDQRALKPGLVVEPTPLRFSTVAASLTDKLAPSAGPARLEPGREAGDEKQLAVKRFGRLPLSFEPNQGQGAAGVRFVARGLRHGLIVKDGELVLEGQTGDPDAAVHVRFEGGSAAPRIEGQEPLAGRVNYLVGNDRSDWRTNVPLYGRVRYRDVYPGIDLVLYGSQGELEYDFVVHPGVDPSRIHLSFEGADSLRVDASSGDIVLATKLGELRQRRPLVYQERDGRKIPVTAEYVLVAERQAGIKLAAYDPERPLVLDPVLVFSSYLGGDKADDIKAIAVDPDESLYAAGNTSSAGMAYSTPTVIGTPPGAGVSVAFVAKLNASGSALEYLTYVSTQTTQTGSLQVSALAVDDLGRAYLAGRTASPGLPTWPPLLPPPAPQFPLVHAGSDDGYLMRLNSSGTMPEYATYLGGSSNDVMTAVAVDSQGQAYATGYTESANFPTKLALPGVGAQHNGGGRDAFVTSINAQGTDIVRSTYLGGSGLDQGYSIACRPQSPSTPTDEQPGGVYVLGYTYPGSGSQFPTTPGALKSVIGGPNDYFLVKLFDDPASATPAVYSTLLGGSSWEREFYPDAVYGRSAAVAVDTQGTAYVCGLTHSSDFPPGASSGLNEDRGFCVGVADGGSAYGYQYMLGDAYLHAVAVDPSGAVAVAGVSPTVSGGLFGPLVNPLQSPTTPLTMIKPWTVAARLWRGAVTFSTYLGTTDQQNDPGKAWTSGVAVDRTGGIYVGGGTSFATLWTANELQPAPADTGTTPATAENGFIAKISTAEPPVAGSVFEFSQTEYRTPEEGVPSSSTPNQPVALVTVSRSGDTTLAGSVTFATVDGTATAGLDYTSLVQRLDFVAGEVAKTVEVPLINDDLPEANTETVKLVLTRPVGGSLGGAPQADLVIEDDDGLVRTLKIRDRVRATGPNWTITEAIPWLTFTATAGFGPSSVVGTADGSGLPPGTYTDYFIVTGDTGDSPQVVAATLKVLQ